MKPDSGAARAIARNVAAYDRLAGSYDAGHDEIFNPVEQARLADAVRGVLAAVGHTPAQPARVLDVGAGTGNLTSHFIEAGALVTAADISAQCLALVERRFASSGRLRTQRIDGTGLGGLADGAFDVAACYSVLHHVPDYAALVGEMARVVRSGGLVMIDHERHDASWTDASREQFMLEAWVFPPKRWTRFITPSNYWNRIKPLLQWQRWFDKRWMPEGDLHIWPDDHIEWARIERAAAAAGLTREMQDDYLAYDAHFDRTVWERWRERLSDHRLWTGRKQ